MLLSMISRMAEQIAGLSIPVEHLVVSDGIDDMARVICDGRARYAECLKHKGIYGGNCRDLGIAEAKGEWVWFADDDDFYPSSCLATIAENIGPSVDAILFQMRFMTPEREWKVVPDRYAGRLGSGNVGTPCVVLRRQFAVMEKWDTQPPRYDNDYVYYERIWRHKPRVRFVQQVIVESVPERMDRR